MARRRGLALLLLVVVVALLACAPGAIAQSLAPIPPLASPVVDTTSTLDAASRRELEQQALALQQRKGAQLQILMVPTTQPEDIAQYTVRVFDQYRLGREKSDDGLLIVVAKDDRRVRIETGYGLEGAIPDATAIRVIQEYMVPRFRQGDYAGGLRDATAVLVKLVDGEALPPPMAPQPTPMPAQGMPVGGGGFLFGLIAALFVAQFFRAIFGRAPAFLRGILTGGAAGAVALLIGTLFSGVLGGLLGFFIGLGGGRRTRYARNVGFGGIGWGGGGFGGGGGGEGGFGGGWGGGGGMSGGGGASGSW